MGSSLWIDAASPAEARDFLLTCCGSPRWADAMLARRPFGDRRELHAAAREEWMALEPADWLEAFSHHPQIGDRADLRSRFPDTAHLSASEQREVGAASDETLDELAALNRRYAEQFGYIFIVCATGKSADEILALIRGRLDNDAATELRLAAEEQARITELRLQRR
jgi:2-oxo-4-hydroxy-4-carboxy-5-ureidoimidazoline decarboxylase